MPLGAYLFEDVHLVGFMYLVFSRMLGESYCRHTSGRVYVPCTYSSYNRRLRSLCDICRELMNSHVCRWCPSFVSTVLSFANRRIVLQYFPHLLLLFLRHSSEGNPSSTAV